MLAYVDPNWVGLPVQSIAPWLIAILVTGGGAALALFARSGRRLCSWLWRRGSAVWPCVLAVACLVVGGLGTYTLMNRQSPGASTVTAARQAKLLVLGMDGLDPDILKAMMDEGALPAFKRLGEQGAFRPLGTVSPPQSPVVWSSFATASDPGRHGIFDFIHRDPTSYRLELSITTAAQGGGYVNRRRGKTLWKRLSEHGVPVKVLFCPCEFPPEPVRGCSISGMGTPDMQGTLGRYTLVSSDPGWNEKDIAGQLVGIAFTRDDVTFSLPGVRIADGGKSRDLTVPVSLHRPESGDALELSIGEDKLRLSRGQWSRWIRVQFRAGLMRKVRGICRFYLASIKPELNLYCTPVQFDPADPVFPISHPPDFAKELAGAVGLFATLGMPLDTKAFEDEVLDAAGVMSMAESIIGERRKILRYAMDRWDEGLLFFYFGTPDCVQHVFWRELLKDRLAEQGVKSLPEPITRVYRLMDEVLAEVLKRLEKEPQTQLIVMSDHGFDDFSRAVHANRILSDLGYLKLKDGCKESRGLFRDVDWSGTRAYACGFSSIYINLRGREGQGVVEPGEIDDLLARIRKDLLAYEDQKLKRHPFQEVMLTREAYSGELAGQGPDIVIGCRVGYRFSWQTALGAVPSVALEDNKKKWRGDHIFAASSVPGILLMRRVPSHLPTGIESLADHVLSEFGLSDGGERKARHGSQDTK